MILIKNMVDGFGLSIFFVASITLISLLGILISKYYNKKSSKKETCYLFIILSALLIHILIDTLIYFHQLNFIEMMGLIWDFVLLFSFLIIFYLLSEKLNKFWVIFSLIFLIICVSVDIVLTFYPHFGFLSDVHFLSILGLFIGTIFLVIKLLMRYPSKK